MDDPPRSPNCRICLGSLEFPRNLAQPKYKHLKQILNQILGYEIPTQSKSGAFNICYTCENKLTWILEFKDLCEKSLSAIQEIELKKELSDTEGSILSLPDNDNDNDDDIGPDYPAELILFEESIETPSKRKKSSKSSDKAGKLSKSLANVKLRRTKYKQYSANVVMQAISECSNYITDAKTRTCIFCAFEGTTSTVLSVHMYKNHSELTTNWCNRCNIPTENLEMHRIATQCAENRCKFCSKKCKNINKLGEHLKLHCHSFFKEPDGSKKYIVKPEVEAPTMIWFKEDPFAENTDFIDTLKEGIKGANEKVLKRQLQRISSATMAVKNSSCQNSDDDGEPPTKQRKCRFEQFPYKDVEKAMKDTMRSYHTNRKCIVCGTKTRNGQVLSVHMTRMHKKTRTKWCLKCNEMFDNLEEHSKQHKLECVFCQQEFFNLAHLKTHLKAHSRYKGGKLDSNWVCCKHCQKPFATKEEMKDHECKRIRSKNKNIVTQKLIVTDIDKNSDDSDSDDQPLIRSYNKAKSRYKQFPAEKVQEAIYETMKAFRDNRKCIVCGHLAPQLRSLSLHMSQFHKDVADKWCSRCNTLQDQIKEHKESHKDDLLKCKLCEKRYTKTLDVRLHLRYHAQSAKLDVELKWFSCKKCPKSYQTERELKEHECEVARTEGEDSSVKLKTCKICGDQFPNLRIHMKQIHWVKKGPKQRLCPICGKVFVRNYELTVHVRTHTGEKPFKCSFCDKQFNIRRSLQVHERRHVGEKRHICHICAKAFVTSAELKTHSRIHETGSVSEQCPICEKKFYRSGVLQVHMKKHRGFQTAPRSSVAAAPVNNLQLVSPPQQMEVKQPTDPIQMFFADIC